MSAKIAVRIYTLMFIDIILINLSIGLTCLMKFDGRAADIPSWIINNAVGIVITTTLIKVIIFGLFKLYKSIWRYAGIFEICSVIGAAIVSNLTMALFSTAFALRVSPSIFMILTLTDIFLIGGARFAYRLIRRALKGSLLQFKNSKRILVAGNGETGSLIVRELKSHPELKSIPVAITDDNISKLGRKINGVPIIGQSKDICNIVQKKKIDEIIIASATSDKIYKECLKTKCKIKILPSYSQLIDESFVIKNIREIDIEDLLGREPVVLDIEGISSCLKDKTVIVTGGGGSIGSEICRQVAFYKPMHLIILDNYENGAYEIQVELMQKYPCIKLTTVIANIREKDRISSIFNKYKPDLVFHSAAHKHVPLMEENPGEAVKNNILGTLNVVECSHDSSVGKFVLISTDKAVNPISIMGATKRIAEMIIQAMDKRSNTEFVAVRFGNVLGSSGSVIPLFKKQIEEGGPVTVTHSGVTRFFMTIPEAVQLVLEASVIAKGGEILVLDMGKPVNILELAKNLITLSGLKPEVDIKINITGLRPGEKLHEELMFAEENIQATRFNKIFITKPVYVDFDSLKTKIYKLASIDFDNIEEVSKYIRLIVPDFKQT